MDTAPNIRAHLDADVHLQSEINHALLAVADGLSAGSDRRLVRILKRTLEASWTEHVSFQEEVVFPIIEARHGQETRDSIDRLRSDHASLSQRHGEVAQALQGMLHGRDADPALLDALLRMTVEQRRSHVHKDAELDKWLPATFTEHETWLCAEWISTRPRPRFPLNLLGATGRPIPRLGGRLH
ncbi:MAG: hypothetical protein K8F92_09675 [Hyphomicrobium sp.]|uniref:hypothetical protein n=1 Tax=Hyphomicrobium sp. TaxID=82 RepID=UPI0013239EA6|nr:hypothetical protein [Hyphomicrobium sp.]KAB2939970.1 MAG: hypothetical protein F9K20_15060 [Hyphomicrobium sp.]MBZ0209906.1 hypothetical protein [Hyphomicrobium sp.]